MLRGLYTAAAGMLASTISTDVLANNLSNISTVGYKRSGVNFQAFPEMLINRMSAQGSQQVGALNTGSKVRESVINFIQGSLRETGNTFDMAIEGEGFFTVKDSLDPGSAKTFYTRAGNFTVNEDGYLTTPDGAYVQGELGNIILSLDQGPYQVNSQGEISAGGRLIDRLKIGRFIDNNVLQKVGDNLYEPLPGADPLANPPGPPVGYKIHQGTLEQANTNVVTELVNNIQGLRLYEALQKNIHFHNETLGKAVNEVGRSRS